VATPESVHPTVLGSVVLSSAVAEALRELIFAGEFRPGDRLVEAQLADRFGTSRGPIRDAFADLTKLGLLTSIDRRGTFVASLSPDDVDEVYSLRSALESLALERAATSITPLDLEGLATHLANLADAQEANDPFAVGAADMAFHRTIVSLARHRRLLDSWERLADQTRLLMQELSVVEPSIQSRTGDHGLILAALTERDGARAKRALVDHLASSRRSMIERFSPK
jgi:DNA-binding GntR family transcriptional regulator